jgi:hypothetical protein
MGIDTEADHGSNMGDVFSYDVEVLTLERLRTQFLHVVEGLEAQLCVWASQPFSVRSYNQQAPHFPGDGHQFPLDSIPAQRVFEQGCNDYKPHAQSMPPLPAHSGTLMHPDKTQKGAERIASLQLAIVSLRLRKRYLVEVLQRYTAPRGQDLCWIEHHWLQLAWQHLQGENVPLEMPSEAECAARCEAYRRNFSRVPYTRLPESIGRYQWS